MILFTVRKRTLWSSDMKISFATDICAMVIVLSYDHARLAQHLSLLFRKGVRCRRIDAADRNIARIARFAKHIR